MDEWGGHGINPNGNLHSKLFAGCQLKLHLFSKWARIRFPRIRIQIPEELLKRDCQQSRAMRQTSRRCRRSQRNWQIFEKFPARRGRNAENEGGKVAHAGRRT